MNKTLIFFRGLIKPVRTLCASSQQLDMTRHAFPVSDSPCDAVGSADGGSNSTQYAPPSGVSWGDEEALSRVEAAVAKMREEITAATGGLTASAGIAPNRMLAKVASDMRKPNGQFVIKPTRDAVLAFVRPLPVRKISGIGKVTGSVLERLGVVTCADMFEQRRMLSRLVSVVDNCMHLLKSS